MLLHLSRASFWLAALAAAWSLAAPAGHETALTAVAGVFALAALALWRSAMYADARVRVADEAPAMPVLDQSSLIEAAHAIVRIAHEKHDFEDALWRAADVLKTELGARAVRLHEVGPVASGRVRIAERPATARGTRLPGRSLALGATRADERSADKAIGDAIVSAAACSVMPDTIALPFSHEGRVVALIELSEIGMSVDAVALDGLLDLTRMSLEPLARPLDEAAPEARIEPEAAPPLADQPSDHAVTMKDVSVLVVEDNVTRTEATARLLRRFGCRVTPASGMLAGLQALCERQFDLVLMDTAMPGVGAPEALAWLRGQPQGAFRFVSTSDTPVVAMAPQGLPGDVERFRELGFDDCLFKPLRHDALSAMLTRHLRARSPALGGGTGSSTPAVPAGALDEVALDRLRELDPSGQNHLVERVLKAFQTSAARLLPQLQAAHAAHDNANVRLVAHTLKSSSASIGALTLSHLCAQLENAIRNEQTDEIAGGVAAMTASLHATLESIRQLLEETT